MKTRKLSVFTLLALAMALLLAALTVPAAGAEEDTNYVQGDGFDMTVSSTIKDATETNRSAKHLVDGNRNTEWFAAWLAEMQPNCDEWVLFHFDTVRKVKSVTLTQNSAGTYFPAEFAFTWSMKNDVDIPIPGQSYSDFVPSADSRDNVFTFETPVVASYFKLSVTKRSASGNIYLLSLAEITFEYEEATEEEIRAAEEADAAVERPKVIKDPLIATTVTASSYLEPEKDWGVPNLSDGTVANQWCSEWVNTESENDEIWVLMASVDPMKFTGVILYSQGNICFPRDFRFQYSFNGSEFVDIPGASYTDYQLTDETKHVFAFDTPQVATHIRLLVTKKRANSQGNYLVQIAEVEPRGFEPTQDEIASAENAFNVATDNLPVNPDVKPTPIPVGPDDPPLAQGCNSAAVGRGLMAALLLAAAACKTGKGGR